MKWMILFISITTIFSGCASMNNTGKGVTVGGDSGAALGVILGGVIGKGKGAVIGAAIGIAVGAGTDALIGKKMDKAATEAKQIKGTQVEQIADSNRLQAVKVALDSGILFITGNAALSAAAKSASNKFTDNVPNQNRDMDVSVYGCIDDQDWRNSIAEQSRQKNLNLSQEHAWSVANCLLNCDVSPDQIKGVQGMGESDPITSNDTAAGKEQNHHIKVCMYTSEQITKNAQAASN